MNKTSCLATVVLGSTLLLASCASDEPLDGKSYDGTARFSVKLPAELATRFSDGSTANKLYYSVFQNGEAVLNGVETNAFADGLTQEVSIQLVANQDYKIIFFADNASSEGEEAGYTYNPETAQLNVSYTDEMVNSDNYDAFVKTIDYKATGEGTDVLLIRPFAQLNIGTDDLKKAAVEHIGLSNFSSTLTLQPKNVLSGINFLNGTETPYTGEAITFTLPSFGKLPEDAFPVETYGYLEMNYLLVPATAEGQNNLIDLSYEIKANGIVGNTLNLASTPVKTNYQTNIYGSLLTTRNKFNVEIKPAFTGEYPIDRRGEVKSIDQLNEELGKGERNDFIVTGKVSGSDNTVNLPASADPKSYSVKFENIDDDAVVNVASTSLGNNSSLSLITPMLCSASFIVDLPSNCNVTINGGYKAVTVSGQKTTIAPNADVEQVNVKNGTLAVRGNVGTVRRAEDNPMATKTPVIVYEGGKLDNAPEADERIHVVTFPLFSGGGGTAENPYKLTKAKDLQDILYLNIADEYDPWYRVPMVMENDIDMSSEPMRNLGVASMLLDGKGHTLKINMTSESSEGLGSNVGLFAAFNGAGNAFIREATAAEKNSPYAYTLPFNGKTYIITGGCIRNLTLEGNVYSDKGVVSPLGCGQNTGYIIDVTSKVNVTAAGNAYFVAGIISGTRGTGLVIGCNNYGTIDASASTGGVVAGITAQLYGGSACNGSYPDILAPYSASVYQCNNYGNIIAGGKDVGGIVGQTHGYGNTRCIMNCTNSGNITGTTNVGGIIGRHTTTGGTMMLQNNTSTGQITATAAEGLFGNICGAAQGEFMEGSQKSRKRR